MGLLFSDSGSLNVRAQQEAALFHRMGCKLCPLREFPGRMEPSGATKPLIYVLGSAPLAKEIRDEKHFSGESGELARQRLKRVLSQIRWNNIVRSHPPSNRKVERPEIESCRLSVVADIESSKPKAIFGFGNAPLAWVAPGYHGVIAWRGRKMPVKIGSHVCWYYPMLDPGDVLKRRRDGNTLGPTDIGSEDERMFAFDIQRALEEVRDGLPDPVVHSIEQSREGVEIFERGGISELALIQKALAWAAKQPSVGIDYETNCLRPYAKGAKVLTAAISDGVRSIAIPFDHPGSPFSREHRAEIKRVWQQFLYHATGKKIVHNLAFEMEWTGVMFGADLVRRGEWHDTMTQASTLDERYGGVKPGPLSLEFLVQQYFGFNIKAAAADLNRRSLAEEFVSKVLSYNAVDAKYHALLFQKQETRIKEDGLKEVYRLSVRKVPACVLTQMKGVPVDQEEVQALQTKYQKKLGELDANITLNPTVKKFRAINSRDFNPASNPDILMVFRDMLKRPEVEIIDKYTKKTRFSVDEKVLATIDHPLAKLVVDRRKAAKLLATYIDPMDMRSENTVVYPDFLIHAQFNTLFTVTGRLSAEKPNLQNYPKRDENAKEVRRPIKSAPGHMCLAFDYGQIEARVIAMFTKDKMFVKALWERYDIHTEWAERIAREYPARVGGRKNLTDKKVMKDFRTDIKNQWTFPLFFGASLASASKFISIPEDNLKPLYDAFWKQFADTKEWQKDRLKFYRSNGYVECLTGRRRHGPLSANELYNSPVQGTASEIVIDAQCRLSEYNDPDLQPEINIHDDLSFLRVPEARAGEIAEKIITTMLDVPFKWAKIVPITVEMSSGYNWMEMKDEGDFSSDQWGK